MEIIMISVGKRRQAQALIAPRVGVQYLARILLLQFRPPTLFRVLESRSVLALRMVMTVEA